MTKADFYKVHLKPREAYLYFLAVGESDTTVLPAPKTDTEQYMYDDCVTAATAIAEAAAAAASASSSATPG